MLAGSRVLLAVLLCAALKLVDANHNHINYYYARQLQDQMSSSSSYDYWWPYPPATAAQTLDSIPTQTNVDTNTLPTPTSTGPVMAFSFSLAPSATPSLSANSNPGDSISGSSSDSGAASVPLVTTTISALPPSNSSSAHTPPTPHKLAMVSNNNLIYVVSVCGAAGLLIGGLTAWCVYGCVTRRRNRNGGESAVLRKRGRKSCGTLEVGPEYRPPTPIFEEDEEHQKQNMDDDEGEWLGHDRMLHEEENLDEEESDHETQAFLHPEKALAASAPARHKSVASTRTRAVSPTPSGRTSLYYDQLDANDAVPWESLRHKSIKRGMLERLKDDDDGQESSKSKVVSRRPTWQSHGRHDSDLSLADAQADLSRMTSRATTALSRASSTVTGMGFRIMSESPAGTPTKERNADTWRWPSIKTGKGTDDRYTPAPMRAARSGSRSRSPEKRIRPTANPDNLRRARSPPGQRRAAARARKATLEDVEKSGVSNSEIRRVLPQSPPRVSSPVLDEALCFTPASPEAGAQMTSFASCGGMLSGSA
uniref:Transmembrane protein n=1 Tax=Mycena chlorophos TaxID=658473 RepID=A0ABQ0L189_MYCCL|nr:predicted protein [Mycena chlorophos]